MRLLEAGPRPDADDGVVAGLEGDGVVVVLKGVALGETVVTDGQFRISPGARVMVRESRPRPPS